MSALAEALVAAQRRAVTAMEKQYVAGKIDGDTLRGRLSAIGLTDEVDQDRLTWALDTIKQYGAVLPSEPTNGAAEKPIEKASDAQVRLIQKMLNERELTPLAEQDVRNLSKPRASQLIDSLQAGTYDPSEWDVAF